MWPHFVRIFLRALQGMPFVVSSNWANWSLALAIFLLYEVLAIAFRGWSDMKERWKQNVGIGLLATLGGYLLLFAYSAVISTYNDHRDSTGRWQQVVNEKNKLKDGWEKKDQYIRQLETRSCPACRDKSQDRSEPLRIQVRYYTMENEAHLADGRAGKAFLILGVTNKQISPVNVNLICGHDIAALNMGTLGVDGMYLAHSLNIVDKHTLAITIGSPAWTPEQPLGVSVFTEAKDMSCRFEMNKS